MNDENLKPFSERSKSEARELGRKGGIASGKARREKADLRKLMAMMMDELAPNSDLTYAQLITKSMLSIAASPKQGGAAVRAFQVITHAIGQDEPEQNQEAIDALKEILEENKKNAERIQADDKTE